MPIQIFKLYIIKLALHLRSKSYIDYLFEIFFHEFRNDKSELRRYKCFFLPGYIRLISTGMAAGAAMFGGAVGAGMGAQAAGGGAANLLRANKLANMEGATGLGKMTHMAGSLLKARQQAADQKSPSMGTRLRDRIEAAAMKDKKGE